MTEFEYTNDLYNKEVDLIYIDNLVNKIISSIDTPINNDYCIVDADETRSVENVLNTLTLFKSSYIDNNIIPFLKTQFDLNLFNTFRSYIDYENVFPKTYKFHEDNRGTFIEIVKTNGQRLYYCPGEHNLSSFNDIILLINI